FTGKNADAVTAYHRFLEEHPQDQDFVNVALEAGHFATQQERPDEVRWFLEQALARDLPPGMRTEAEAILRTLPAAKSAEELAIPEGVSPPLSVEAGDEMQERRPARVETPPVPVPPEPPKRRSLGEVLAAFMEDRNILWGELVGGLLIVGCSIALVISLWHTLEENPYTPFFIFFGIATALFCAGLYTLHHWKFESTSRGL